MFIYQINQIVTFFQEPLISRMLGDVHFDSLSLKTLRKNGLIFSVARVYDDELLPPMNRRMNLQILPAFLWENSMKVMTYLTFSGSQLKLLPPIP